MGEHSAVHGPILGIDDEDIGLCDECGSEAGNRYRTVLVRTFDGEQRRVMAWLCGPCKRRPR
jgi:gamma-glutamylcyclotransferase (GGCT)/AIG2-like uncharacterized protein YtfP